MRDRGGSVLAGGLVVATLAPTWDESKFEVTAGQDLRLGIALRY